MTKNRLTAEKLKQLMLFQNKTAAEIAALTGYSKAQIATLARKNHIHRSREQIYGQKRQLKIAHTMKAHYGITSYTAKLNDERLHKSAWLQEQYHKMLHAQGRAVLEQASALDAYITEHGCKGDGLK